MLNGQLFETIFATVIFCLGWRIVTDEGNLLYFIRKPFERAIDNAEMFEEKQKMLQKFGSFSDKELAKYLQKKITFNRLLYYIGKPFVLCITCFGSVWGFSVFVALNGLHLYTIPQLIINCVSASFIQTFIWKLYAKLD